MTQVFDGSHLRILIAPDSFKGSLDAIEVARAIMEGLERVWPKASFDLVPMADGGEGTVRSLVDATGGRIENAVVTGPLGTPVKAFFGVLGDGETAVIEMASASGLPLVPEDQRNPLITTTAGTGELIRAALDAGCRKLIIGIGGSATNDGGAGMVQALGARLLDDSGRDIGPGGGQLARLSRIDMSGFDPRLGDCDVVVACDVDNPLTGPAGASAVYGPQKGATPEMVRILDSALEHYAKTIERYLGKKVSEVPGSGAAGGLGAGLLAFLNASLRPGVEIVIEATGLRQKIRDSDLVITGEGGMDGQSVRGKTPVGVSRLAKQFGKPVVAIAGTIGPGVEAVYREGIDAILPITTKPMSLGEAIESSRELLSGAGERLGRLLQIGGILKEKAVR